MLSYNNRISGGATLFGLYVLGTIFSNGTAMILYTGLLNSLFTIYHPSVLASDNIHAFLFLPRKPKPHKPAGMVIFQNTVAHPFPAWYIFRAFDIIGMVGNRSKKNNTGIFVDCIVRDTIPPYVISLFHKLTDCFLRQPSSGLTPEMDGGVKLFHIIIPQSGRQCRISRYDLPAT